MLVGEREEITYPCVIIKWIYIPIRNGLVDS